MSLIRSAVLGLVTLVVVIAAALFGAAGSIVWWQAWLYLATFTICTLVITVDLMRNDPALLARRVTGGAMAEKQRSQKVIQAIANLLFLAVYVIAGLDRRFGWTVVPQWLCPIAIIVVILGFFIVFRVFRENSFTSAIIEVANEQTVIDSGPYRFVRHPMYAGALLLLIATPPALGSWAALGASAALCAAIVVRLIEEERYLRANLSGYEAYAARVPYRLVPRIW